jgi:hypothetical protein
MCVPPLLCWFSVTQNAKLFAVKAHPTERSVCIAAGWDGVTKIVDLRVPRVVRQVAKATTLIILDQVFIRSSCTIHRIMMFQFLF